MKGFTHSDKRDVSSGPSGRKASAVLEFPEIGVELGGGLDPSRRIRCGRIRVAPRPPIPFAAAHSAATVCEAVTGYGSQGTGNRNRAIDMKAARSVR